MPITLKSATVNRNSILLKVLKSRATQKAGFNAMNRRVQLAKAELLKTFEQSPVTLEIEQGPNVPYSAVLPNGYGNLFSFLGFDKNKPNPVAPVRKLLENIHLLRRPIVTKTLIKFVLRIPSQDDFENASPMEWESGRSWINAVTRGLGGFSHYMFSLREGRFTVPSRSGTALQVATNLRSSSSYFAGVGYVIGMMGKFRKRITR